MSSIEFTISFDMDEINEIIKTILKVDNPTEKQNNIGKKLQFIYENMKRDIELEDE